MSQELDPTEFLERTAASELLTAHDVLPESIGLPPAEPPPSPVRRRLVAVGATLTGVTLIGGIGLIVLGAVAAVSDGFDAVALVALILGVVLVATHWGWVHVAEFSGNAIEARQQAGVDDLRHRWLGTIEPYTRYEVSTQVEPDGSLTIATVRHRPVPAGERRFTFVKEILEPERHPHDELAAVITERAEQRRREAALMTQQERSRFEAALEARQRTVLGRKDEEELMEERRAASEALSRQINTNLRDPPLTE